MYGAVNTSRNRHNQAHNQGNTHEQQRGAKVCSDHGADRLKGFQGIPHISTQQFSQPHKILYIYGLIQPQCDPLCFHGSLRDTGPLQDFQRAARQAHNRIIYNGYPEQDGNGNQNTLDNIFTHDRASSFFTTTGQAAICPLPGLVSSISGSSCLQLSRA